MNPSTINKQQQCPLCGQANSCALSSGKPIEVCWCNGVKFSDTVLEKIPDSEKLTRCLCPACARATGEPALAR